MAKKFFIGELARKTGCSPKAIRFYEAFGLLRQPQRTESRYRLYSDKDVDRIRFIQGARVLSLSLNEIKQAVELEAKGTRPCAYVRSVLREKIAALDRRLETLALFRGELHAFMDRMEQFRPVSTAPCVHIAEVVEGRWRPSVALPHEELQAYPRRVNRVKYPLQSEAGYGSNVNSLDFP